MVELHFYMDGTVKRDIHHQSYLLHTYKYSFLFCDFCLETIIALIKYVIFIKTKRVPIVITDRLLYLYLSVDEKNYIFFYDYIIFIPIPFSLKHF